ncbi:MAG: hypothetical protein QHH14_14695, partial [Clostridiales bacterium]|nr:hypothetical protein [Clostridiales bacterium]
YGISVYRDHGISAYHCPRNSAYHFQATQNHCTIAHISVLLIALAAHCLGFHDKIRFVKTFVPNLNL